MEIALKLKEFFTKKELKKLLLTIYILGLAVSLVLTLFYAFVPSFVTCSSLFGEEFCTPTGLFVAFFLSLPGYLVVGNLLSKLPEIPWLVSLILVIVFSGVFYFFLGAFIDKQKTRKMTLEAFSKFIIYLIFAILLFMLLTLI